MDFASTLDTAAGAIDKPPIAPVGTYVWEVFKIPEIASTSEWEIINFPVRAVSAEEDVDPDDLEAFGNLRSAINRVSFMFSKLENDPAEMQKVLYRLKMFMIKTLQIDVEEDDQETTLKEMMSMVVGKQFMARVVWKPNKSNPNEVFANLDGVCPLMD